MSETLNGSVELHCGDCLDVLATLRENSIDACVTDPPYGLQFMGKEWDRIGDRSANGPAQQRWHEKWAREVYRVLKPGGHLLAFGGTRTYHRMACAIEDAGFEIRDQIQWLYGSGFPKSHDVRKGIDELFFNEWLHANPDQREKYNEQLRQAGDDAKARKHVKTKFRKAAGTGREVVGKAATNHETHSINIGANEDGKCSREWDVTTPATAAARQWEGWGTALKPATEIICLARKPLSESTVAKNVLRWGVGAINVDGCRVETAQNLNGGAYSNGDKRAEDASSYYTGTKAGEFKQPVGRWPANVIHDGSEEVVGAFPDAPGQQRALNGGESSKSQIYGKFGPKLAHEPRNDSGSAARFFYTAKADSDDRLGSKHPTVKPLDLMQYLVRLIAPKGSLVLDPFAGTGTTGEAALREGMRAILIEREPEYQADIRHRMAMVLAGPDERARESIKQKTKDKPPDHGPLFASYNAEDDFAGGGGAPGWGAPEAG